MASPKIGPDWPSLHGIQLAQTTGRAFILHILTVILSIGLFYLWVEDILYNMVVVVVIMKNKSACQKLHESGHFFWKLVVSRKTMTKMA